MAENGLSGPIFGPWSSPDKVYVGPFPREWGPQTFAGVPNSGVWDWGQKAYVEKVYVFCFVP